MARKKSSSRAVRRQAARSAEKIARARERLARLEEGGGPDRPIEVESASQIEPHALALPCLRCDGPNRLHEHNAETVLGQRLRVVRMACPRCGAAREVWFRISEKLPS
jgi:hypothetical protein